MWKCVLKNRPQFLKGVRWKVGNGRSINLWLDNWCTNDSLVNMLHITDLSCINTSLQVSHFISPSQEWDIVKLNSIIGLDQLQLILGTPLPSHPLPNSVCWGLFGNGEFSTKTTTWVVHGLNLAHKRIWEYSWIWNLDIMPELTIFLGQLCHLSLPTRGTLSHRGLNVDQTFRLCQSVREEVDYLFLHCPFAQECWRLAISYNWIVTPTVFDQ